MAQVFVAAARKWRVNNRRCWDDDVVYYGDDEDHENSGVHSKHKTLARTKQFRYMSYQFPWYLNNSVFFFPVC